MSSPRFFYAVNWIYLIWSGVAGICIAFAGLTLLVWMRARDSLHYLLFSIAAFCGACIAVLELAMMQAQSPLEYGELMRWYHVPVFVMVIAIVSFTRTYLQSGRLWLLWLIVGLRVLALMVNFTMEHNLNLAELSGLRPIHLLGETVMVPVGTRNPLATITTVSNVLFLVFILDAAVSASGANNRRRAKTVGIAFGAAALLGLVLSEMLNQSELGGPFTLSMPFLIALAGIAHAMSMELVRTSELARQLRQSEERLTLATSGADVGIWDWDIEQDLMWVTDTIRQRLGIPGSEPIRFSQFMERVHPDDRSLLQQVVRDTLDKAEDFDIEYRLEGADGKLRWIRARGRAEIGPAARPRRVRGVSLDITKSKLAEAELQERRRDLMHFGRVSDLGQLSSALAHEISQPLGAILRNAEAGELFLARSPPDIDELRAILADIRQDEARASAVIERMRSLLTRRNLAFERLEIDSVISEALDLVRVELQTRHASLHLDVPDGLPPVLGDRVHLQQVILNLVLNSVDALDETAGEERTIAVRAARSGADMVEVAVIDRGAGIAAEQLPRMFDPFFTTKKQGTGVGLAISKTIIEAHGGRLAAENNPDGGATVRFTLRVAQDPAGG